MPRGAGDRDVDQDDEEHEENGEHDDEDDGAAPDLDETQKRYRSLSRDESAKADDEEFENICANLKRVSVTISRVLTAASPLIGRQESLGADAGEMPAAAGAADHAPHAGNGSNGVKSAGAPSAAGAVTPADMAGSMEDLRLWYETEVFADGEGQQRSWDVRKWAFMQQLSKELSRPLTSSPLPFLLEAPPNPSGADRTRWRNPSSSSLDTVTGAPSATAPSFGSARTASPAEAGWRVEGVLEGGLVFVGRSRYNDVVVRDDLVSRVHCIVVRSCGVVGVFDGWSGHGTITMDRAHSKTRGAPCDSSMSGARRPLLFSEGEPFTLRLGNSALLHVGHRGDDVDGADTVSSS